MKIKIHVAARDAALDFELHSQNGEAKDVFGEFLESLDKAPWNTATDKDGLTVAIRREAITHVTMKIVEEPDEDIIGCDYCNNGGDLSPEGVCPQCGADWGI
jgi:hypothetical protein